MPDELPQINVAPQELLPRSRFVPRWIPQISLLQLLLIVVIVALGAAYYAQTQRHAEELVKQDKKHQQELIRRSDLSRENDALRSLADYGRRGDYCLRRTLRINTHGVDIFHLYANIDPSQNTLLKVIYDGIPSQGYPDTADTYLLPALSSPESSGYLMTFDIRYISTESEIKSSEPITGKFNIDSIFVRYEFGSYSYQRIGYYDINKLIFNESKKPINWANFIVHWGNQYKKIQNDRPNEIMRFRTKPDSPEPCPGILMWLEIPPKDAELTGIPLFENANVNQGK
jgi:hypothetical protein